MICFLNINQEDLFFGDRRKGDWYQNEGQVCLGLKEEQGISSRASLSGSATESNMSDEIQKDPWKRSGLGGATENLLLFF